MASIVIEVPEELKSMANAIQEVVRVASRCLRDLGSSKAADYAAVERTMAEGVAAVERASHEALLGALDVDHARVIIGGRRFTRVGHSEATYYTMAGPVPVKRALYREDGKRNAKVVDAVSLRAGVVAEYWLPHTARAMAHQLQQSTSRDAEQTGRETYRLRYSRSSYERVGHAIGELYLMSGDEVEDALIEAYEVPAEARSVSVSLDRVSIPMEEPRARPAGRPRKNAPKRPIERNYRMGYCGTITLHDETSEAIHTIRYGRMPDGDAIGLAEALAADVTILLRRRPDLAVVKLLDGAPQLWSLLDSQLEEEAIGKPIVRLLDKWHVLEKLDAAAVVMHGKKAAGPIKRRWRIWLLNSSKAAERILGELRLSGKEWVPVGDTHPVHEAITYLQNHLDRLDYAAARRDGLPVGSGNVEATCKSLVEIRMKRAGSRWKDDSGEHIIQLRALALSDRWPDAMQLTLVPLRRAVRRAA